MVGKGAIWVHSMFRAVALAKSMFWAATAKVVNDGPLEMDWCVDDAYAVPSAPISEQLTGMVTGEFIWMVNPTKAGPAGSSGVDVGKSNTPPPGGVIRE